MPKFPIPHAAFSTTRTPWRPGLASRHSATARRAVMCSQGPRHAERVLTGYFGRENLLELHTAGEVLCSGVWDCQVQFEGQTLQPKSRWQETCWFSDRDTDYLELELRLGHGVRVERSILLAKQDRFVYLADAILPARLGPIDYLGSLPLAPGAALKEARQTREARLRRGRGEALVLPLGLGEWRADGEAGELAANDGKIQLRQQAPGGRLWAALWLDLDRRRTQRPFTWRRLTVAEDRRAVPNHVAVGYRVQAGAAQWLLYRSLGKKGNRTLLAHNLSTEMLVGRFTKAGEVEKLLEIE
jgi:hypothetical protein